MLALVLKPWHIIVFSLSSHLNREQQRVIEYLQAENQVPREKLGKGCILLNDAQRHDRLGGMLRYYHREAA